MNDEKRPHPPLTDRLPGEERLSRLYQETTSEGPSPGLDVTVLDAARRAARQKPRRVHFLTSRKWAVPLSLAAALVVTVGIVRSLRHEMESPSPASSPVGVRPSAPFRADERNEALHKRHEQKQPQAEEAPGTMRQTMKPLGEMADEDAKMPARPSSPKLTAPAERQERKEAPKFQTQEPLRSVPSSAKSPPPPALPPGGTADQSKEDVGAVTGDSQRGTSAQRQQLSDWPEQQQNQEVTSSLQATEHVFHGASASEERGKMRVGGAGKEEISADESLPDEWITEIKKLRRAGKLAEAEASLKAFKERYPDYPIEKALTLPHQSSDKPKDSR